MLIPFYNPRDKRSTYLKNNYKWIDLNVFLNVLNDNTIKEFKDLSAFRLNKIYDLNYINLINKKQSINIE